MRRLKNGDHGRYGRKGDRHAAPTILRYGQAAALKVVPMLVLVLAQVAAGRPTGKTALAMPATRPDGERATLELSPLVERLLKDPVTSAREKLRLEIFHGQWNQLPDSLSPRQRAQLAMLQFKLDSPLLKHAPADPLWQAKAALYRGNPRRTLALLKGRSSAPAAVLRARADEQLGRLNAAIATLTPIRDSLGHYQNTAPEATAAGAAVVMLAQLQGRPAADYHLAMTLLGHAHEELDPLYWPAYVAEAKILMEKDNRPEAFKALAQALTLNPESSEAWYQLGVLAESGYDFKKAQRAIDHLRAINPRHLLADELEARLYLTQQDVASARRVLAGALARFPRQRQLLALKAATEALAYDQPALKAVLTRYDQLAPGSPRADYTVGRFLARARQYAQAANMLRRAIGREPRWPAPQVELGLLLMQWGKLPEAQRTLRRAAELDPFNRQVHNQLTLVNDLLNYQRIDTPHFIIRYQAGIDAALARDMPGPLEKIYTQVTRDFAYQPARKTQIDLLPDEQAFAVRITGMPDIWTIAACTGDVIALTPPRLGAHQRGPFDWVQVVRHEFTHTVTLDQTHYRVPHWFTEACAVSEQTTRRSYHTYKLLAWALNDDKLFTLNNINWGFVRPQQPYARDLAYAQARWMLQYIVARWSHQAIIDLLKGYDERMSDKAAMRKVTGQDAAQFMRGFKKWAHKQVAGWGLTPTKLPDAIAAAVEGKAPLPNMDKMKALLKAHPDNADVLELYARKLLRTRPDAAARRAVERYAAARPVDPWAQRTLVRLAIARNDLAAAVAPLKQLDEQERHDGRWAYELARIERTRGRLRQANLAIVQAIDHEPYNPSYREFAATIALQRGDLLACLHQLQTLALLEPHQAIHQVRLAALYAKMHEPEKAAAAAKKARQLDPHAPVDRFLHLGEQPVRRGGR